MAIGSPLVKPGETPPGNVAASRASAICILVGSPALFELEYRILRKTKMAHSVCKSVAYAAVYQNTAIGFRPDRPISFHVCASDPNQIR